MNWATVGLWLFDHTQAALAGIGITGGGFGLLTYIKHMPSPRQEQIWLGSIFDTLQDLVKNNERIGQRRDSDSAFITKTEGGKTASASAITDPPAQPAQKEEPQ